MKQAIIPINLYEFSELNTTAKTRAIEDHRQFLLSIMTKDDFISGDSEHDTPEKLQEVFESEYDFTLYNDEPVIESIEINEYLFYSDGDLAPTTTYLYGDKKGKTIYKNNGIEYELKEVI